MPSKLYPDLSLTNFPDSVDSFITWLDIVSSDGPLIKEYQNALSVGDTSVANQVLSRIPSYRQKIIKATDVNKLEEALTAVERFYKTDITPYTNAKQAEWQKIIDKFSYAQDFDVSKSYSVNNYVSYGLGSSKFLYIAIKTPPQGTLPTNSEYWRQLTVQGKIGAPGKGIAFEGNWDGGRNYATDVCVQYNGYLWISLRSNIGKVPSDGSDDWGLIAGIGRETYPVTSITPTDQLDGELWFKIIS